MSDDFTGWKANTKIKGCQLYRRLIDRFLPPKTPFWATSAELFYLRGSILFLLRIFCV